MASIQDPARTQPHWYRSFASHPEFAIIILLLVGIAVLIIVGFAGLVATG